MATISKNQNVKTKVRTINSEIKKVQKFQENWAKKNPYNGNLAEHNRKFKKDFNSFLTRAKLSINIKNLFFVQ